MPFHGGLDWGGTSHAVCIIDGAGQIVLRFEARHDAAGLVDMATQLSRLAAAAELPIAIERLSGLIVDALVAAGHPVIPIHPNVVKVCRPRYRAAGGKSDPGDAYMLADILRTDEHRFRPLMPASDDIRALRALVRGHDDLLAQRVALANQRRSLLEGFWPAAAAVFAAIDSPIALAFVARYPTPDSASRLGEKRIAGFLAQHAYCGRRALAEAFERLGAAIAKLCSRIEHAVAELPDGKTVMSFPRAGRINAAQILVELGDVRERFHTEDQLAAEAGVCPVTHGSGKSRGVVFRWACNKNLRLALTCFADNSPHAPAWAAAIHLKARSRGCRHPHAIRILARASVRILWRAWHNRTPYDPQHHAAAKVAS